MGDEKEGPYKVVAPALYDGRDKARYSIVKKHGNEMFFREVVPDAGDAQTARHICNLLNKNWKEKLEVTDDETAGADGLGLEGNAE